VATILFHFNGVPAHTEVVLNLMDTKDDPLIDRLRPFVYQASHRDSSMLVNLHTVIIQLS
jgi:hypothetical protein